MLWVKHSITLALDEAISEYKEALSLKPDFPPAQHNLELALSHEPLN